MRRDWTTCSKPKMSIMDLPYKIHDELSKILDPDGAKNWKQLVSLMTVYTAKDVKIIETEGSKPGMSCTLQLLQDMDNRDYTVHELKYVIKLSGNEKALRCLLDGLDDESLIHEDAIHEDTITGHKRKRHTRSPPEELEEPSDLHIMKRHKTKIKDISRIHQPTGERGLCNPDPGRRGTLAMDHSIHQPTGERGLCDTDSGRRGTLAMDHSIHQPTGERGLCNPDSGRRGTLAMDHSIHQPTGERGLCNPDSGRRGTLAMDNSIHQPTGERRLCNPDSGRRGTLAMDHSIHQATGERGICNPDPGRRGILATDYSDPEPKETPRIDHPTNQHSSEMIELPFPIQDTIGLKKDLHKRCSIENSPSENDETQYHDGYHGNKLARAPMPCLSASSGKRLPTEHEDNKQESAASWIPASFLSLFVWMISCGSQGEAI